MILDYSQLIALIEQFIFTRNYGDEPLEGDDHQAVMKSLVDTLISICGTAFGVYNPALSYAENTAIIYNDSIWVVKPGATMTGVFDESFAVNLLAPYLESSSKNGKPWAAGDYLQNEIVQYNDSFYRLDENTSGGAFASTDIAAEITAANWVLTGKMLDAEITEAYNNEVPVVTELEAIEGTVTEPRRWTPERVSQVAAQFGVTLVNDLFTGGISSALTAEQGKVLKELIDPKTELRLPTTNFTPTARTAAEANQFSKIAQGDGVCIAVSSIGTNRVMRSVDNGVTWVPVSVEANFWNGVAFDDGVFIIVAGSGTNRVMRSVDKGVTWIPVVAAENNVWNDVTGHNGVFIAVAGSGTNRVMRSIDKGVSWEAIAASEDVIWLGVAGGDSVFIAIAYTGNVMVSTDLGETWAPKSTGEANILRGIAFGDGVFIIVCESGTNRVLRTTDYGENWTSVSVDLNTWFGVAGGEGVFIAVAVSGTNRVMISIDKGVTWVARSASEQNQWKDVVITEGYFVAISSDGANRVMTAPLVFEGDVYKHDKVYTKAEIIELLSSVETTPLTGPEIEAILDSHYANINWRTLKTPTEIRDDLDALLGGNGWRVTVAGAALINAVEYANSTDGVTSKGLFDYINKTPKLKNLAVNGNCDVNSAPVNWYAGASAAGGNPDNATIYDIPNPPKTLVNLNATRGFIILEGDNNDTLRIKPDTFPTLTPGSWVKMYFYLFTVGGNYSPTPSDSKIRAFREGAAVYDITTNLSVTKIEDKIYRMDGYGHLDFSEAITDLQFEYKWSGGDARPDGAVYVTGLSISESADSPDFTIIDNFVVGESKRSQYNLVDQNRAKIAPYLLKQINKEVNEYNELPITFVGDSIMGDQIGTNITSTPGEENGHYPPNMHQQLVSYQVLEALQFPDADVQYYNMLAAEITESGTWSTGRNIDGIRTRRSTTVTDYFEITVTNAAFFKFVFHGSADVGATFDVLINNVTPTVAGITGDDVIDTGTQNTRLKWGYRYYSGLDPETSYTFRFIKTNTTNTSIWGCEAWTNPRVNVINNGNGGQTASEHLSNVIKFSSLEYRPALCIHELPTINDSFDNSKYIGFRDPDSTAFSPTSTGQFFRARSTGVFTNYGGGTYTKDDLVEWNGSSWSKGSSVIDALLTNYNNRIVYLDIVAETGVPTLLMTPHRTVSYALRPWQQQMTNIARMKANALGFALIDIDHKYEVEDLVVTDYVVGDGTHLGLLGPQVYTEDILAVLDLKYNNALGYNGFNIKPKKGMVLSNNVGWSTESGLQEFNVIFDCEYIKTPFLKLFTFHDGISVPVYTYPKNITRFGFTAVAASNTAFEWEALAKV